MAESIKLSSKVKVFAIENEEGKVLAELRLDPSNDSILGRFMDLYDNSTIIAKETKKKLDDLGFDKEDALTIEQMRMVMEINKEAVSGLITETDAMFGADFTKQIFADHYAIDENFIPNISLFQEFYEKVMPVVKNVYQQSKKNYSVKKGKR